jgi:hypothetical protein
MGCGSETVTVTLLDDLRIGDWLDGHGLLRKTIEKLSAASRISTIETKGKFIKIVVKVLLTDGSLMRTEQPSFQEGDYSMDPREKFARRPFVTTKKTHFVDIAVPLDRKISRPGIGVHHATGLNRFPDVRNEAIGGGVQNLFHPDPSYALAIFLSRNNYQRFVRFLATSATFVHPTDISFVNLDPARQPVSTRSDHCAT